MQKKFDVSTAKKLLSLYAEKVNFYMKENKALQMELNDTKTSLEINKEILYKQLNKVIKEKEKKVLIKLKEENDRLNKKNSELYKNKVELEKKLYVIQQQLDESLMKNQELLDNQNTEIFLIENKIKEKDNLIFQLKKEINKYYKEDFNSTKELIICDPDKVNIEMNNELCETRELIGKYSRIIHDEKRKSEFQEKQIERLNNKILVLKKKKKIKEKMENIQMFDYILTSSESSDQNSIKSDNASSLESPIIKFPEKIKQPKYLVTDMSDYGQNVPKLDFTKLLTKYQPLKQIEVVEGIKKSNRSNEEYLEKLKFQLKIYKNSIIKYKKKNKELKKLVLMIKQHYINLKNSINNSNSTKDTNKKNLPEKTSENNNDINKINNDDSMNANTSQIDIESSNMEESDFNYVIKEYNKNVIETEEKYHHK